MASPTAARSKWVNREVTWWLENKSSEQLLVVLTEGELAYAEDGAGTRAALPPALRDAFRESPHWVDLACLLRPGHTGAVYAAAFSPDGHTLATGSGDKTVRLRNVTDPACPTLLGPLTGHTDNIYAVTFSPNGHTLATGSDDRTVRLWGMEVNQAIQRICATTANTLAPATWARYVSPDLPYRPPCP
jgi:WD40 repeat protein